MSGESILQLEAYRAAYAQLRGQKEDLKHLRSQASICAAVCGLIGTLFGALIRAADIPLTDCEVGCLFGLDAWLVVGLSSIALSVWLVVAAVVSYEKCTFEANPSLFIYAATSGQADNEFFAELAVDLDKFFDENERVIGNVKHMLTGSLLIGWLQIPAWLLFLFGAH